MERITAGGLQLVGSKGLSTLGRELRLSDEQAEKLTTLCRQMQAYYPHQEFLEETIEGYQFDLERLSVLYGLDRVRTVLLNMRIEPGRKWFPHPSDVSEALEELMKKEREEEREANPWHQCGRCSSGMVIVEREGGRTAERCQCWINWKRGEPAADRKSMGVSE